MKAHMFLVAYDLPHTLCASAATFHRRLNELLTEFEGVSQYRALQSVYVIEGKRAGALAYTIGLWAERFGAGPIGSPNGVIVLPLGTISPTEHQHLLDEARAIVEELGVDRRLHENKRQSRRLGAPRQRTP